MCALPGDVHRGHGSRVVHSSTPAFNVDSGFQRRVPPQTTERVSLTSPENPKARSCRFSDPVLRHFFLPLPPSSMKSAQVCGSPTPLAMVESATGRRKPEERAGGMARCRNHRLVRRQFRAAEASGEVEEVVSVLAEALNSQNTTGRFHSEVLACMLSVGRKLKMEILAYIFINVMGGSNDPTTICRLNQDVCRDLLMMPRVRVVVGAGRAVGQERGDYHD